MIFFFFLEINHSCIVYHAQGVVANGHLKPQNDFTHRCPDTQIKKIENWVFSFSLWIDDMFSQLWKIDSRSSMTKTDRCIFSLQNIFHVFFFLLSLSFHLLYKANFTVGTMMMVGTERKIRIEHTEKTAF